MLRPVYGPVWESHPKSMSHTMKKLKITELEAEKGDAKMTLVPCIMALTPLLPRVTSQVRVMTPSHDSLGVPMSQQLIRKLIQSKTRLFRPLSLGVKVHVIQFYLFKVHKWAEECE
jgi:hypothetical protein